MKPGFKSVTLKEETIEKLARIGMVQSNMSVEEAVSRMVLVIEEWRRKNLWDNWSKAPLEVEHIRFETENPRR